jgi:hypothetical protein
MTPADKDLKYRLKYNTILAIHGQPKLSLWFEGLPSMNTYYNMHRFARSAATAEWRYEARQKAYDTTLFMDDFLIQRAFVVVNVFPPYEEISDIHNIVIKPILDGFSDAGVWSDDEWAFCPLVMYAWAGIGEQKPRQHKVRRTRIDLYELAQYKVRGEAQILPKGRKKLYG